MLVDLLTILACSTLMRIKGGGVAPTEWHGKPVSILGFGALTFFFTGVWWMGLLGAAAWWLGILFHVRDYLTNLGGYKGALRFFGYGSIKPITFLLRPLEQNRQKWGFAATALRGLCMGLPCAAVFQSFSFLIAGLAMAPAYWLGMSVWQWARKHDPDDYKKYVDGWSLGEWFWGAAIGAAFCWSV